MVIKDIINELYLQNRRGRYSAYDFFKDHLLIDFGESPEEREKYEIITEKNAAYIANPSTKSKNVASVYDANELRIFLLNQYKVSENLERLVAHNEGMIRDLCSEHIYDRNKFREMLTYQISSDRIKENQKEALEVIDQYYDYASDGCNFTACALCALFYPKYGKTMISHTDIMECLDNIYHRLSEENKYMLINLLCAVEYNLGILSGQMENISAIIAEVNRTPVLQATREELLTAKQPGIHHAEKAYEILRNLSETIEHHRDNIYTYARDIAEPDSEWLSRLKLSAQSWSFLHDSTFEMEPFFQELADKIKVYILEPHTATGYPEQKRLFLASSGKIIFQMSELLYWHYVLLLCPVCTSIDINECVQFISVISMFREHSLDFRLDLQKNQDEIREKIASLEKMVRSTAGDLLSMDLSLDVSDFIARAGFPDNRTGVHHRNEKFTYAVWDFDHSSGRIEKQMVADRIGSIFIRQDNLFHITDQLLDVVQNQIRKRNLSHTTLRQLTETISNAMITFQRLYERPVIYMIDPKVIPALRAMKINYKELEIFVNGRYECVKEQIFSLKILKEYVCSCDYDGANRYCESYRHYQKITGAYQAVCLYYLFVAGNDRALLQYIYENVTDRFRSFPKTKFKESWMGKPYLVEEEMQKILDTFESNNLENARVVGQGKQEVEKLRQKINPS